VLLVLNAEGKRIIIELYDKFFKTAFPKMVEKWGLFIPQLRVVDFIIGKKNVRATWVRSCIYFRLGAVL
jgi:predicted helicase